MEAEHYRSITAGSGSAQSSDWTLTANTEASGGQTMVPLANNGVNTGANLNGPRMDFDIAFSNPGTYRVWVRQKGGSSDDSVHVGLDGVALTTSGGSGLSRFSNTWNWVDDVDGGGPQNVSLSIPESGSYTFNVSMRKTARSSIKSSSTPAAVRQRTPARPRAKRPVSRRTKPILPMAHTPATRWRG